MELIGILFTLFIVMMLSAIFVLILRRTGPWGGFWTFFMLLFFIALGAGEWSVAHSLLAWGYYWAPGLISAFIVALILASASSVVRKKNISDPQGQWIEKKK